MNPNDPAALAQTMGDLFGQELEITTQVVSACKLGSCSIKLEKDEE